MNQHHQYFDDALAQFASQIEAGDLVVSVKSSLRGCHPLTRQTREWLKTVHKDSNVGSNSGATRPTRVTGMFVPVKAHHELFHRCLLLLDAIMKTFVKIGVEIEPPADTWDRSAVLSLRGFQFGLRFRERTKRVEHVLTDSEALDNRKWGMHWGSKFDHVPTGDLRLEITRPQSKTPLLEFRNRKRAVLEQQIGTIAAALLRRVDDDLKRRANEWAERKRQVERIRQEETERARAREIQELRDAEASRCERLFDLADHWARCRNLKGFLEEFQRVEELQNLEQHSRDRLLQWRTWAGDVLARSYPASYSVDQLIEFTHDGADL